MTDWIRKARRRLQHRLHSHKDPDQMSQFDREARRIAEDLRRVERQMRELARHDEDRGR